MLLLSLVLAFTPPTAPSRHAASSGFGPGNGQLWVHDPYVTSTSGNVTPKQVSCTQGQAIGLYDDGGTFSLSCLTLGGAAGASGVVQYNNSGSFGGITNLKSDGTNLQYTALTSHPAAPAADSTTLYSYEPSSTQPQGLYRIDSFMGLPMTAGVSVWTGGIFSPVSTTATWLSECHIWGIWGASGTANSINIGSGTTISNIGANFNQISWANTNYKTHQRLAGSSNAGTNNTNAGFNLATLTTWRGNATGAGGFVVWQRTYIASGATSRQRFFAGLAAQTTALSAADPSATTNTVYFGCDQGQDTLRICSNDNSGTATCGTDLGSNFPCTTNGAGYDFWLAAKPNDTAIYYYIERLDSAQTASGNISSDLPQNTVQLAPQVWINNGSDGGNTTVRVDWGGLCMLNNW